jgi:hypothetical protein
VAECGGTSEHDSASNTQLQGTGNLTFWRELKQWYKMLCVKRLHFIPMVAIMYVAFLQPWT